MTTRIWALAVAVLAVLVTTTRAAEPPRPNILWISCEDMSPNLGCYGDKFASTPNLDQLAKEGIRYTHAFSVIGVCAPSRSAIITGMYPTSIGSHNMRCQANLPEKVKCFPEYLQAAGYYCSNNVKEDYNFRTPKTAWNESSKQAHWKNRKKDQPFFAVFNLTVTHESQIRTPDDMFAKQTARLTKEERHDPAKVKVPSFHPDTPAVRRDWARYYDLITAMDKQAGDLLKQLADDGLAEDTIVFFWSDHGVGLPRGKRWLYDTGIRVPLLVRFPKKFQHLAPDKPGTVTDRLVSLVDLGPTVLSLAEVRIPNHMQGQAFLGKSAAEPREAIYAGRDRMDERTDMSRAVRDKRWKYIANYMWHLPHAQSVEYMEEMPTMKEYRRLAAAGKLEGSAALFMRATKPPEELYDTEKDPEEIHNLAQSKEHRTILEKMRERHRDWARGPSDLGLLPEAMIHEIAKKTPPYEFAGKEIDRKVFNQLLDAAQTSMISSSPAGPRAQAGHDWEAIRFWGIIGLTAVAAKDKESVAVLEKALEDKSPTVRVAAAEALGRIGHEKAALPVLQEALKHENDWVRHAAALALDRLGDKAKPALPEMKAALKDSNQYVVRIVRHTVERLEK